MNTRVANAEAYIYAAIKKADRDSFTVNEIASIVVGEFLVKKMPVMLELLYITNSRRWPKKAYSSEKRWKVSTNLNTH